MRCSNCGKEIQDNSKFCVYCGAVQEYSRRMQRSMEENNRRQDEYVQEKSEVKEKGNRVKYIVGSIAGVLLAAAVFAGGAYCTVWYINRDVSAMTKGIEKDDINNAEEKNEGDNADVSKDGGKLNYRDQMEELTTELASVQQKNDELEQNIKSLQEEKESLGKQVNDFPELMLYTPSYIKDGMEINKKSEDSICMIDNRAYVAVDVLGSVTGIPAVFDKEKNVFAFGEEQTTEVTSYNLFDTDVLYDGDRFKKYLLTGNEGFLIGGKEYREGIEIETSSGYEGYILLNLNKQYSKVSFDIGRTESSDNDKDIQLEIYLDDKFITTYDISGSTPITHVEIPVDYAGSMKIIAGDGGKFGFADYTTYGLVNFTLHK